MSIRVYDLLLTMHNRRIWPGGAWDSVAEERFVPAYTAESWMHQAARV